MCLDCWVFGWPLKFCAQGQCHSLLSMGSSFSFAMSPRCPAFGLFWGHYIWRLMRCPESEHRWMVPRCWCGARSFPSAFQVSADLISGLCEAGTSLVDSGLWWCSLVPEKQALCQDHQLEVGELSLNPGSWAPEWPPLPPHHPVRWAYVPEACTELGRPDHFHPHLLELCWT